MVRMIRGTGVLAALALAMGAVQAGEQREDLSGVWQIREPVNALLTKDGKLPPLLPEARSVYDQHVAARKKGDTTFDKASWCAAPGIPRLLTLRDPFEIVVRPRRIAFLFQWDGWYRVVDMISPKLDVIFPSSMGVPVGHWEGATLVVETVGLTEATQLDTAGLPHGENLRITERIRLVDHDRLENLIAINDPDFYSQPWEAVLTYRRAPPGARIREDVCLDRIKVGEPAI